MGNVIADLVIKVRGEGGDAINEMDKVENRFSGLASGLKRTGLLMSGLLTAPILAGGMMAFNAASDLTEAISATTTVYGESANAALDWSKTTADSMGIARTDALTAINQYAALGKAMGKTDAQALDFSKTMVTAASDLSSFWNTSPEESLAAIRSGLAGEMEPLKRYGIIIDENSIAQRAMAMTGKENAASLTLQEKAAARAELIVEGLGDAQGDFARTADGAANAKRRLIARTKDLVAIWGQKLLPIGNAIIRALLGLTDWIGKVSGKTQAFIIVMAALVAGIGPAVFILGILVSALGILLSPIGLVVLAVAGLLILFPGILDGVKSVIGVFGDLAKLFVAAAGSGEGVKSLIAGFPEPLQKVALFVALVGDAFGDLYAAFTSGGISGLLAALPGELAQIGQAFSALGGAIMDALGAIDWGAVFDVAVQGLKTVASAGIDLGSLAIDGLAALGGVLGGIAADFIGWLKRQLLGGGATGGDGTGGPGGGASGSDLALEIGSIALDGLAQLGSVLAGIAADFGGWLWGQIKLLWDGKLKIGDISVAGSVDVAEFFGGLKEKFDTYDYNNLGVVVGEGIRVAIEAVGPVLIGIGQDIIGSIKTGLEGVTWTEVLKWVALIPVAIPGAILLAAEALLPKGKEFIDGLLSGLGLGWDEVIVPWLTSVPGLIADFFLDALTWLEDDGENVLEGLWAGIEGFWDSDIRPGFEGFVAAFPLFFFDAISWLEDEGGDLFEGLWNGLDGAWDTTVKPGLEGAIGDILGKFATAGTWLIGAGWALMSGLAGGIYDGAANKVTGAIDYVAGLLPGWLKRLWGIESPSKVAMWLGSMFSEGIAIGLTGGLTGIRAASDDIAKAASFSYGGTVGAGAFRAIGAGGASPATGGAVIGGNRGSGNVTYNIFALKADEYEKLLRDAENGAAFADEFASDFGA